MGWHPDTLRALWLTAQTRDDALLAQVRDALPPQVVADIERLRDARRGFSRGERARAVDAAVRSLHPAVPTDAALPPRALAWLARDVPRDAARAWLAAAPSPRQAFQPSRALRLWLARLARRSERP